MLSTAGQSCAFLLMLLPHARLLASAQVSHSGKPFLLQGNLVVIHYLMAFPLLLSIWGLIFTFVYRITIPQHFVSDPSWCGSSLLPITSHIPYVPHMPAKPVSEISGCSRLSHTTLSLYFPLYSVACCLFLAQLGELFILSVQFRCNLLWEALPAAPLFPHHILLYRVCFFLFEPRDPSLVSLLVSLFQSQP